MKNKLRLARIIFLGIAVTVAFISIRANLTNPGTAFAVGDLTIDWGVPSGDPIFVVNNMVPGDMEQRDVDVTNGATSIRPVGVRGVETSEIGDLSTVLDIVISEGATDLYGGASATGPKTLSEFFTESAGPDGIPLSDLDPGESTTYSFKVTFSEDAGNAFQNASVIFDLIIGIAIEVPEECSDIQFDGNPIFGTSRGDRLNGGPGNDLIFGLEGGDSINGNGGADCIVGGEGSDRINGNAGNDVILGQEGSDSLKGNNGEDLLIGGEGSDSLDGGNEDDVLDGGNGSDSLKGGNGEDDLFGGDGSDSLKGGNGADFLDGGGGTDSLNGGPNSDECINGEAYSNCEIF